jgi:hypothetical protein
MGGLDTIEILQSIAGVSCFLIIVAGLVVGIVYLIRLRRTGGSASSNIKGDVQPTSVSKQKAIPLAESQLVCGECGTANPPGNNFCEHCGATLN